MRTHAVLGLLAALTLLIQDSRPEPPQPLSRADAESDLAALEAAIRAKWSYLEERERHHGLDLAALVARARTRLADGMTRRAFHDVVSELVADLRDGHAAVFTLGVPQPRRRWPVAIADAVEGVVIVKAVGPAGPLVTPGDRIVAVDGIAIDDAVRVAEAHAIASTPAARRRRALGLMVQTDAARVALEIASTDGARRSVALETVRADQPDLAPAASAANWSVDHPAAGVARIHARSFTVGDWAGWLAAKPEAREAFLADDREAIDAAFRAVAGSRALVIDLRGNGGGTDLLGIHFVKHLLRERFVYYHLSSQRAGRVWSFHGYEHDPWAADKRYDGPVAVLIDEDCFSVTDNALRALVENRPDVIVVGRPTNGGTGAPRPIVTLPKSETTVTLCTMRVYGPKGGIIEGRGTQPTIPVRWTAADFLGGRDPDLAAALDALGKS